MIHLSHHYKNLLLVTKWVEFWIVGMTKDKLEKKLKNNEIIPISLQKFKKKS